MYVAVVLSIDVGYNIERHNYPLKFLEMDRSEQLSEITHTEIVCALEVANSGDVAPKSNALGHCYFGRVFLFVNQLLKSVGLS